MEIRVQSLRSFKAIPLLAASAIAAGFLFSWLWREWFMFALTSSVFLLLSGGLLLSSKQTTIQAVVLGAAIGAFVGSAIGISSLLSH
ncbi:MAG: hypothetical protein E6Q82_12875 [Thiobacillus sp.]|nr:MAG: hypothetical protein E6Q82_12875 [Thiobacillus sp.]